MKKDDYIRIMNSIVPVPDMKTRLIIKLAERHNRYRIDKPLPLIASVGAIAIVCAGAMMCALIIEGHPESDKALIYDKTSHSATISYTTSTITQAQASPSYLQLNLLDNIQINTHYDKVEYGMEQYKPQGYSVNIRSGLAREMEKHISNATYLFDVVVKFQWSLEDYKKTFIFNGMSYDKAVQDYTNKANDLHTEFLKQYNRDGLSEKEKKELLDNYKSACKELDENSYKSAFQNGYEEEFENRKATALSELEKNHTIPIVEIKSLDGAFYSEFTRQQLLYLADAGYECMLVGKHDYQRPSGYPEDMSDEVAIIIDRTPSDAIIKINCSIFYCNGTLAQKKYPEAEQALKDLLRSNSIEEIEDLQVYSESIVGRKVETRVHCVLSVTKEKIRALISENLNLRIDDAMYKDAYLDYVFNMYGDGFASMAS
jgi:hypothetical protein